MHFPVAAQPPSTMGLEDLWRARNRSPPNSLFSMSSIAMVRVGRIGGGWRPTLAGPVAANPPPPPSRRTAPPTPTPPASPSRRSKPSLPPHLPTPRPPPPPPPPRAP